MRLAIGGHIALIFTVSGRSFYLSACCRARVNDWYVDMSLHRAWRVGLTGTEWVFRVCKGIHWLRIPIGYGVDRSPRARLYIITRDWTDDSPTSVEVGSSVYHCVLIIIDFGYRELIKLTADIGELWCRYQVLRLRDINSILASTWVRMGIIWVGRAVHYVHFSPLNSHGVGHLESEL